MGSATATGRWWNRIGRPAAPGGGSLPIWARSMRADASRGMCTPTGGRARNGSNCMKPGSHSGSKSPALSWSGAPRGIVRRHLRRCPRSCRHRRTSKRACQRRMSGSLGFLISKLARGCHVAGTTVPKGYSQALTTPRKGSRVPLLKSAATDARELQAEEQRPCEVWKPG